MAKKVQYTTNQPAANTDYLAADNTWKTIPGGGGGSGTVTSVALTAPAAFNVSGSPITTSGTIAISGAGTSAEYVKGDGTLGTTPTALPPNGAAGGDLSGTYPNPTVHRVHGIDLQSGTPNADDVWVYGGSPAKWQHQKLHASQTTNDSTVSGTNVDDALDTLSTTKQNTITGAATTITSSNLTGSRALVSNGGGKVDVSAVTTTELGRLVGVTSDIQTQLDAKGVGILSAVYGGSSLTAGQTTYAAFENIAGSASENLRKLIIPIASTMSKFYTLTNSTQPATGALTFTIRKNSVDSALVITIAAGSGAGTYSNTANSVTFAAGDAMNIKFVNNASSASASVISISCFIS